MRSSAVLLVAVLLAGSLTAGIGAGHPTDDGTRASDVVTEVSSANKTVANGTERDETQIRISLRRNGDARWNVTARFVLADENETAAFRDLGERYVNGNADAGFSASTFERTVEYANTGVSRRMAVQNVTRSAKLDENGSVGTLSLSFTWTNFTLREDNQIVMGDVFWVGSETWLPTLNADQSLVIEGPDGYIITDTRSSGGIISNGNVLRYDGPQTFQTGDFAVRYAPRRTVTPGTTTPGVLPELTDSSGLALALVLFGLGGLGAYAWSQRHDADSLAGSDDDAGGSTSAAPIADASDGEGDDVEAIDDEEDEPAVELLSDEERVVRLLEDNDGRMKQAQIVTETNWSNAKVSQLLSKMNDDGDVDKLRIGRENLITLPDVDVTDTE